MKYISLFQSLCGGCKPAALGRPQIWLMCFLALLLITANADAAAIWYVDSAASGANNGTSWTNAWTSLGSASGSSVHAGDTVYISGGSAGNSQTYSGWSGPKNGTVGSPITYQIGQDASHNGTVIFSGSGSWLGSPASVVISGMVAGDGAMHFQTTGYSQLVSGSGSHVTLSYINFGTVSCPATYAMNFGSGVSDIQVDHCWLMVNGTGGSANTANVFCSPTASAYDTGFRFLNNVMYVPCNPNGGGLGNDGIRTDSGSGVTIAGNMLIAYSQSGGTSLGEHQDGIQNWTLGSYYKMYNNMWIDFQNADINLSAYYGGFSHVRIYNNICGFTSSSRASQCEGVFCSISSSYVGSTPCAMTDCVVANNLAAGNSSGAFGLNANGVYATWSGSVLANNITIQGASSSADAGILSVDNVNNMSAATAVANFSSYSVYNGTNNNFKLLAGATSLIGRGTNLTAYGITTDFANNPRPATGNWDIGPYEYLQAIPVINTVLHSGANLIISGTNGSPNGNYLVLASTNLVLPRTNWTRLSTNSFDGSGNFIFTNPISSYKPGLFYLLQLR